MFTQHTVNITESSESASMATSRLSDFESSELFGFAPKFSIFAMEHAVENVPIVDVAYLFDPTAAKAILLGFSKNLRVFLHGVHGGGKSTHIEQIAARLHWPCIRLNLDGHVSRSDLVGKDTVTLREGKQVTVFKQGVLTWAMQNPVALILDEYDAGRPDVMFVLQQLLETNGKLVLLEENQVIHPHPDFRLFATANTIGHGDITGQYAGTQALNQAQLDRWHIVAPLEHMPATKERKLIEDKIFSKFGTAALQANVIEQMVVLANLTRTAYRNGDLPEYLSTRNLLAWAETSIHCEDDELAFKYCFLNRCEPNDQPLIGEFYQRCFGRELHFSLTDDEKVY